jgi:hypothetical protein
MLAYDYLSGKSIANIRKMRITCNSDKSIVLEGKHTTKEVA